MTIRLLPAVLSGGSGTRLWPLSTNEAPKQFHALGSDRTMLQDTVKRFETAANSLAVQPPIVICNAQHRDQVTDQLRQVGVRPLAIVLEPFGRNSAPAAVVAARLAEEADPEALVILMASDHCMVDPVGFSEVVARAAEAAESHIVTFGVKPTAPETGYGYIEGGAIITPSVRKVARFAEKPDRPTAEAYLADGGYLWNAGIFLFKPQVLLAEMERHAPEVLRAADAALAMGARDKTTISLNVEAFAGCPSISLDYAVMEQTDRAAVAQIEVGWADIGSWSELWRLGPRDGLENFVKGDAVLIDTQHCLVWGSSRKVAVIGLSDVVVVETPDAILVVPRSRAQDVKLLVEQIKARGDR